MVPKKGTEAYERWKNSPAYEKLCLKRRGKNNPRYGKEVSKETRKKISKANTGRIRSEKTKKKMSDAVKGSKNPFFGKKHSKKTRRITHV